MSASANDSQFINWELLGAELEKLLVDPTEQQLRSLEVSDLVYLKYEPNSDIIGPFEKSELKVALEAEEEVITDLSICSASDDWNGAGPWTPLATAPFFQRRRPQLMSTGSLEAMDDSSFYVLRDGVEFGPITLEELKSLAEQKELLATDLISVDGGETFGKMYEWDEFDRRNLMTSALPQRPNEDFLTLGNIEVLKDFKTKSGSEDEAEAMANLAYVGAVKTGKVLAWNPSQMKRHRQSEQEEAKELGQVEDTTTTTVSAYLYAMMFAVSVIGILYMGLTWQTPSESIQISRSPANFQAQDAQAAVEEPVQKTQQKAPTTLTPIEKIPPAQVERALDLTKRKVRPLGGTPSFRESNSFKKALQDNALIEEEGYSYDDGTAPMEHDPVRSQVSKETFDPELSPIEESLADEPYPEELSGEGFDSAPVRKPASVTRGKTWVDDAVEADVPVDAIEELPPEEYYESEGY